MSIQPIDIALFLVSFAACFYCIVLSRRLRALHDTKEGIGATIMALSRSVTSVSATTEQTRTQAGEMAMQLGQLLEEAESMCARVTELTQAMEKTQERASKRVNEAQADMAKLVEDIQTQSQARLSEMTAMMREQATGAQQELTGAVRDMLDQSKARIAEMSAMMQQMRDLTETAKTIGGEVDKARRLEQRPVFKAV